MGEFVEQSLEELLGVYEQLEQCELFKPTEVRQLIKRCRRFEYRLQKQAKEADDYIAYADYLNDVLRLLKERRRAIKYFFKKEEIDAVLKRKTAAILRQCCERFQKRISFLKWSKMFGMCSRTYTRALQFHSDKENLWIGAAKWEFFANHSAENARRHLQLSLRLFPASEELWLTFFMVEINFVKRLNERKNLLVKKRHQNHLEQLEADVVEAAASKEAGIDTGTIEISTGQSSEDEILDFRLAEIVVDQALMAMGDEKKNELMLKLWRIALACEFAATMEKRLYDRLVLDGKPSCEEGWIAMIEKQPVEADLYELYDQAVNEMATLKMFRLYEAFLKKKAEDDPFAKSRLRKLLEQLHERDFSSLEDYIRLIELGDDDSERFVQIIAQALKKHKTSAKLWSAYLRVSMENGEVDRKTVRELFNRAIESIQPIDQLEIWQLAIDWTLSTNPEKVAAVFDRAFFITSPDISAKLKIAKLELEVEVSSTAESFEKEYRRLAKIIPNRLEFHSAARQLYRQHYGTMPGREFLLEPYENAINEFGTDNAVIWLDYAEFLLEHKPEAVSQLYQRAQIRLQNAQADEFTKQWTLLRLQKKTMP